MSVVVWYFCFVGSDWAYILNECKSLILFGYSCATLIIVLFYKRLKSILSWIPHFHFLQFLFCLPNIVALFLTNSCSGTLEASRGQKPWWCFNHFRHYYWLDWLTFGLSHEKDVSTQLQIFCQTFSSRSSENDGGRTQTNEVLILS